MTQLETVFLCEERRGQKKIKWKLKRQLMNFITRITRITLAFHTLRKRKTIFRTKQALPNNAWPWNDCRYASALILHRTWSIRLTIHHSTQNKSGSISTSIRWTCIPSVRIVICIPSILAKHHTFSNKNNFICYLASAKPTKIVPCNPKRKKRKPNTSRQIYCGMKTILSKDKEKNETEFWKIQKLEIKLAF